MKKRILAFLLTAVMAASAFAGCSSKGESAPEGGDTGSSGAAGAGSGAAEEPYDLTFMYIVGGDYPDQAEVEQAMKDLARKNCKRGKRSMFNARRLRMEVRGWSSQFFRPRAT